MKPLPDEPRFHHLDAVRAGALLLGILLHALLSFLPGYREANWPLADASTSAGLGIVYFVIHIFRMSLFFLIAGFFARLLHGRLATRGLLKNRLRRLGLPLIAFYFVTMPLVIVAMVWGARQLGIKPNGKMDLPVAVIGPPVPWGHLWFLYLLLVICLLVLVLRSVVVRVDGQDRLRPAIGRLLTASIRLRVAPLLLTAPIALALYAAPWWVQWQGYPSPIFGLVPNFPGLLAYGSAFLVGWFLHRDQDGLRLIAADWAVYLAAALAATAAALYLVGITPKLAVVPLDASARAAYAVAYTLAQWCWTFALLGCATRYLQAPNPRWRYLADASYWMYLVHLPLIMLLQAWMLRWPLHWAVKLPLIVAIAGVVLLASYHYLVRPTFMGVFLNGRKYPRTPRGVPALSQ
ncbi:MAG: acyltransferase family protein [Gammaproteobacteria bacterium]